MIVDVKLSKDNALIVITCLVLYSLRHYKKIGQESIKMVRLWDWNRYSEKIFGNHCRIVSLSEKGNSLR